MRALVRWATLAVALAAGGIAAADDGAAIKELAPTGKLRVAIAVGPATSALYTVKGDTPGSYHGVTVTLATALAKKLNVPLEFVPYLGTGEIQGSAASGVWDVSFMPVDETRKKFVDFGAPYHLLQSTYLIAPGSDVKTVADANRADVRIAGVAGTATFRASNAASANATHITVNGVDEMIEFDGLALDQASHRVMVGDRTVALGPTEYRMLEFFMTHPERVYTRDQLLDRIWGGNVYVEERTIDVHIRRLRKALEEFGYDRFVQTVRGSGYRFSARTV